MIYSSGPLITKVGTGVHLVALFTLAGNDVTNWFRLAEIAFRKLTYLASFVERFALRPAVSSCTE